MRSLTASDHFSFLIEFHSSADSRAVVIGLAASVISNLAVHYKNKSTLDDTLDVFPCHGVGGMVGMVCTGIFAKDVGLVYGKTETFFYHLLALVIVFSFGLSWVFTSLGLVMRSPNATMNAGFMAIFPLTFLRNVYVEPDTLPSGVEAFVTPSKPKPMR